MLIVHEEVKILDELVVLAVEAAGRYGDGFPQYPP